jgi:hypothetical protein
MQAFHEKKWDKFTSDKVATLAFAQIQGKAEELAKHFEKRMHKPKKIMIRLLKFHSISDITILILHGFEYSLVLLCNVCMHSQ